MAKDLVNPNFKRTPTHDEIAAQAYEIYLREGCPIGRDLEHWLRAEEDLRSSENGGGSDAKNGHSVVEADLKAPLGSRSIVEAPSSAVMTAAASPISAGAVSKANANRGRSGKR